MNSHNANYTRHSQNLILIALSDGQWHRIKELKEKIKLSPRTLYKRLNELENELKWIERKEDMESGEYPHPVLYRATEMILSTAILIKTVHYNADNIKENLKKTKDPLQILEQLHKLNLYYFTLLLETIQENKCMPQKHIDFLTSLTIYEPFQVYVNNLITTFTENVRFGAQFDINQLRQKHGVSEGKPDH
jgi:DNA-binding HxlR family transcriptional regulator